MGQCFQMQLKKRIGYKTQTSAILLDYRAQIKAGGKCCDAERDSDSQRSMNLADWSMNLAMREHAIWLTDCYGNGIKNELQQHLFKHKTCIIHNLQKNCIYVCKTIHSNIIYNWLICVTIIVKKKW